MCYSMMNSKLSNRISIIFYIAFSFGFLWLLLNVILNNQWYYMNQLKAIFSMLFYSVVLFFVYKLTTRYQDFLQRNAIPLVAAVLMIVFGMQLSIGYWFRITPSFDVDAIYNGAITWNKTGNLGDYMDYFCQFPNNLGGLFALSTIFRFADLIHFTDYNGMAIIFNGCMIVLSFLLIYLTCSKLFGTTQGMAALLFSVCCLPLLFYTPVFYTDTLSICFPILGYYLYIRAKIAKSTAMRIALSILIGVVFSVGMFIKMTVIIMLIAILIDMLLTCNVKKYILPIACSSIIIGAGCLGFLSVRSSVLDHKIYQEKNLPYSHWIMMGLKDMGTYNGEDYDYTYSFATLPEKKAGIQKEIKARMEKYNPISLFKHLSNKTAYTFGSGQYGVDTMLDDDPQNENWFHSYVIYTDETNETHFKNFNSYTQGYHLLLLLLIAASSFAALKNRKSRNFYFIGPKIAITGLILFLMMWEASSRYIINYLPVMVVCAFSGLDVWNNYIEEKVRNLENSFKIILRLN